MFYFAYGSNMLSSRLGRRVPSAKIIGRASLYNWIVNFSKKSIDGSGKANLIEKDGFVTWGCLYEIDDNEIEILDKIEIGYTRKTVNVRKIDGESVIAEIYISDDLIDIPVAFDSYKNKLIQGALEHDLPQDYVQFLKQLPSKPNKGYYT